MSCLSLSTARRNRRHPPELKLRLVRSYLDGEGSMNALAKAHGISHSLLRYWVALYRHGDLRDEERRFDRDSQTQAKIRTLECRIRELEIEMLALRQARVRRAAQ